MFGYVLGLCEWSVPEAGMFLWMKVPGVKDTQQMVMDHGLANDVLVVPGSYFMINSSLPTSYIRVAFSITMPDRMEVVCCVVGENLVLIEE